MAPLDAGVPTLRDPPAARRGWRPAPLLVALAVGVGAWLANAADRLAGGDGAAVPSVGPALVVDGLIGLVLLGVLPLRRRHPVALGCLSAGVLVLSAASLGPAVVAIHTVAARRRPGPLAAVALSYLLGQALGRAAAFGPAPSSAGAWVRDVLVGLLVLAIPVAVGSYASARAELISTLRERARNTERTQAIVAEAAREAERTRIAREMHDALAHRISLVALHAGALAYREDLTREETTSTAATIRTNAHLALTELHQVLGILRAEVPAGEAGVEEPLPSVAELPALLADAREAGTRVQLEDGLDAHQHATLRTRGATVSRAAFRIAQEGLTNARKHAPGAPVLIRLAAGDGRLTVEVTNPGGPVRAGAPPERPGVGLVGLRERAELLGGSLEHGPRPDGSFTVRASLPWPM